MLRAESFPFGGLPNFTEFRARNQLNLMQGDAAASKLRSYKSWISRLFKAAALHKC